MCGGTMPCRGILPLLMGLSPRVRGNRRRMDGAGVRAGSIPACAGEPSGDETPSEMDRVYPRVCGGTSIILLCQTHHQGLSPRVRGNRGFVLDAPSTRGSIPACAGEPATRSSAPRGCPVYPRVCGGTFTSESLMNSQWGLSPRVRGNRRLRDCNRPGFGSIPACAGEPICATTPRLVARVYPRVCGGTPGGELSDG